MEMPLRSKLHKLYIFSNKVRHPITNTFTTLHSTTLHSNMRSLKQTDAISRLDKTFTHPCSAMHQTRYSVILLTTFPRSLKLVLYYFSNIQRILFPGSVCGFHIPFLMR
jgi:hypothetical protein